MAPPNSPQKRLAAWLKREGKSQKWLADRFGLSQPSVSRWCSIGRPDSIYREPLEVLTGIEASAWLTKNERRAIEALRPTTAAA